MQARNGAHGTFYRPGANVNDAAQINQDAADRRWSMMRSVQGITSASAIWDQSHIEV
jgi:hypothetical protein